MDYGLDSEQEDFRQAVRQFATKALAPHYQRDDKTATVPREQARDQSGGKRHQTVTISIGAASPHTRRTSATALPQKTKAPMPYGPSGLLRDRAQGPDPSAMP